MAEWGREQRTVREDGSNQTGSDDASLGSKLWPMIIRVGFGAVVLFALTAVLWANRKRDLQPVIADLDWWEMAFLVTLIFVVVAVFVYFVAKRTLWDLLQLLIVPLVLAAGGLWFTVQQEARQQQLEADRADDAALQAYLDQMSTLLVEKDLRASGQTSEVRTLARARTLTVLERVDSSRRTQVMRFLLEANLVQVHGPGAKGNPVISLADANLSGADLSSTQLTGDAPVGVAVPVYVVDLSGADLNYADLSGADLSGASLYCADLVGADLSCADLSSTLLEKTDLTGANLRHAKGIFERSDYLGHQSFSLAGATMPNGQRYEDWLKDKRDREVDRRECAPS